jgi:hypothetical protein
VNWNQRGWRYAPYNAPRVGRVLVFCIERSSLLASYNAINKEDSVENPRDAGQEGDDRKNGGEPRILQCPLEEGEDGDWEIDNQELEASELTEL